MADRIENIRDALAIVRDAAGALLPGTPEPTREDLAPLAQLMGTLSPREAGLLGTALAILSLYAQETDQAADGLLDKIDDSAYLVYISRLLGDTESDE